MHGCIICVSTSGGQHPLSIDPRWPFLVELSLFILHCFGNQPGKANCVLRIVRGVGIADQVRTPAPESIDPLVPLQNLHCGTVLISQLSQFGRRVACLFPIIRGRVLVCAHLWAGTPEVNLVPPSL